MRTTTERSCASSSSRWKKAAPTPAVGLLEHYGIDALLCGTIDDTERTAVGMAGIMLFPGYSGKADDAALRFLSGSVVSDPNNHCNACGFKGACSLKDKGGCGGNWNSQKEQAFGLLLFWPDIVTMRGAWWRGSPS